MNGNHNKISFAIKNTNWCNLKCAHCSECSGPHVAPNIMPLDKVEQYIGEFCAMPLPKWEYMVFTGGETMAPYFMKQYEYIPQCLEIAGRAGLAPFIKTNGVWGTDDALRRRILNDCANAAIKNNTMTSMDVSIDEFHNTVPAVARIIQEIVSSEHLARCVRVSISGLDTLKSHAQFNYLIAYLKAHNIHVFPSGNTFIAARETIGTKILFDFGTPVSQMGRAKQNNIGEVRPDGSSDAVWGNCLQIDNEDVATLNYFHKTPVNGRTVYDVTQELLLRTR
ncbi:MAG: radical SAM protein [Alphaproteobacteria bacterium]|nr:radical SAM protein [Alphaproteobacteria bacterium]